MQYIAIIGDSDSVKAFGALGFDVFEVTDFAQSEKVLRNIINNNYAIIYITENLISYCSQEIDKHINKTTPAIVPLPGAFANTGIGMLNLKQTIQRAVGYEL